MDLNTGKVLSVDTMMNPQIKYGEEVISRVKYAMSTYDNPKEIQRSVIGAISQILVKVSEQANVKLENVYEVVAVGNTIMHHSFLGICPKYLGLAPFCPVISKSTDVKASELGLKINKNANVHLLPIIGGFVGADCVAVILATRIHESEKLAMAMDMGTNTEVVLGNKDCMTACSCASGPAFEGLHIRYGMRASTGAIEKVKIDPDTFDVEYKTVYEGKPLGLCGSALIDLLAEMLKTGIMDVSGRINDELKTPRIRNGSDGPEFVVSWKEENGIPSDIVITQKDVRELQLAKAAMRTGAELLMKNMKVEEKSIDVFYIAGAFGSSVNPVNARIIGMYPEIALERIKTVGNAAGTGARMALKSKCQRRKAEEIARKVRHLDLATDPDFAKINMKSNYFPYADPTKHPEVVKLLEKMGVTIMRDGTQRNIALM